MRADGIDKALSINVIGKLGRSGGFGAIRFGYNSFGFYSKYFGIYSKKYYYGKKYLSKMKFYRPTNPRTIKQQNWRAVLAYSLILWRDFDDEIKEQYRLKGQKEKMTGYNYFTKWFLKTPSAGFGAIRFGYNAFGFY